ncbi:MAG TPA: MlaD family protein [Bacteroidales bacterium]|nr:MlaD family protein [Bacteroidales bacterium]
MKISREFKLGVLFVITLLLLGWGIQFLKGKNIFSNNREFYGIYNQIEGLLVANPVTVNGFEVGQVTDIDFTDDNTGRIIVTMEVRDNFTIPENTVARIYSSDIMGSKAVALNRGNAISNATPGDTLLTDVEGGIKEAVNKQVAPIKNKAENLLSSIDTVVTVIQGIFNKKTREGLANSFESIEASLEYLNNTTYNIDTLVSTERERLAMIIGNLEAITRNIDAKQPEINNVINNLSAVSDTIAKADISTTLKKANKSIDQITAITKKLNEGQGSAGKLLNNDSLYLNLEAATHELNMLLLDMKLHPQRYVHFSVFGRGNKRNEYIPPEEEKKNE